MLPCLSLTGKKLLPCHLSHSVLNSSYSAFLSFILGSYLIHPSVSGAGENCRVNPLIPNSGFKLTLSE